MRRSALTLAGALAACGLAAGGCSPGGAARQVQQAGRTAAAGKAAVSQFTAEIKAGAARTFAATYRTTGTSPVTVLYAARPPHGLAFRDRTAAGTVRHYLVGNSSGEYTCAPPGSTGGRAGRWTCRRLSRAAAAIENQVLSVYTPAHWAGFLQALSVAAGFAGEQATLTRRTVNGFALRCLEFRRGGGPSAGTICATSGGVLGHVHVTGIPGVAAPGFELVRYSSAPPDALFELPRGAALTPAPR